MTHPHSDAKPPINFFGALVAGVLGVRWAAGPLQGGDSTSEALLYVAGGLALTSLALLVCWRWGDDSIGTLPGVAIPAILLAPQLSPLIVEMGPRVAALVVPGSMLVVVSVPLLLGRVKLPRRSRPPLGDASPRSWVKRVLAHRDIDLTLAETVARREDASDIADRLAAKLERGGARSLAAAAYLGYLEPERLAAMLQSSAFEQVRTAIAHGGAIAGVDTMAESVSRFARELATTPQGLDLAAAAARFGDPEPLRVFLPRFDEDPSVFHALVEANTGATPLLEALLLDSTLPDARIRRVCSIARRIGPEMVPFLDRMVDVTSDPRVGRQVGETLRSLR